MNEFGNPFISLLQRQLEEDAVFQDVTTCLLYQDDLGEKNEKSQKIRTARLIAKDRGGVFCGQQVLSAISAMFPGIKLHSCFLDGKKFEKGQTLVIFEGKVSLLLSLERSLLNLISHLCGVASLTRKFVELVAKDKAIILCTRKTLPGLRFVQLIAVEAGGGQIHRRSLADGILIKENHILISSQKELLRQAHQHCSPLHKIEIEVQSLTELEEVLSLEQRFFPHIIMLDNFSVSDARIAMQKIEGKCLVECSGGITENNIQEYSALGVDFISIGKLTHSASAIDLSFEWVDEE